MEWTQALFEGGAGEVIAIDGKTVRGSHDRRHGRGPRHQVRARATEAGPALGQVATEVKSNEIVAIPVLLRYLELKGAHHHAGTALLKCVAAGRVRNGAESFSTLRHFALNLRKQHAPKLSDRKKRIRAGFSDAFREQLLASTVI